MAASWSQKGNPCSICPALRPEGTVEAYKLCLCSGSYTELRADGGGSRLKSYVHREAGGPEVH